MKNKTKVNGVEITLDDGNTETDDIVYEDETYAEENDAERIKWMKKQLRCYGYTFINEKGKVEK